MTEQPYSEEQLLEFKLAAQGGAFNPTPLGFLGVLKAIWRHKPMAKPPAKPSRLPSEERQ